MPLKRSGKVLTTRHHSSSWPNVLGSVCSLTLQLVVHVPGICSADATILYPISVCSALGQGVIH